MQLLITAATGFEIAPLEEWLQRCCRRIDNYRYQLGSSQIDLLISGVGIPLSAFSFGRLLARQSYDLAIQGGIAGALDRSLEIGQVVRVSTESFGDLGVEEADGSFTSAVSLGLIDANQPPFVNGELPALETDGLPDFLPPVKGTTVSRVHGPEASIAAFRRRSDAQVESMEGACFAYACRMEQQPFLQIRAISNYVEARNRDNWNISLAVDNLNEVLKEMVQILAGSGS